MQRRVAGTHNLLAVASSLVACTATVLLPGGPMPMPMPVPMRVLPPSIALCSLPPLQQTINRSLDRLELLLWLVW
jgi:hypothetical protein